MKYIQHNIDNYEQLSNQLYEQWSNQLSNQLYYPLREL